MLYKNLKCRATVRATLEYVFRENPDHGHKMQNVVYLSGSALSPSPLTHDSTGKVIGVNVDELTGEFEFQTNLYNGKGANNVPYDHSVLSLAPNESISNSQWAQAAQILQDELNFSFDDTLWCGGIHLESRAIHLHLISNRVKNDGSLVSMYNNYERAQVACRKIEKMFGLIIINSSHEVIGEEDLKPHTHAKRHIPNKNGVIKDIEIRQLIRRAVKNVFKYEKPQTIIDYVNSLKERGVEVIAREGAPGEVIGLSYRMNRHNDKWYSGSKVSSQHATWGSLLRPDRKNLSYNSMRDNPALGLASVMRFCLKINKRQVVKIKQKRLNFIIRELDKEPYVDFTFCTTKQARDIAKMIAMIMKIFSILFGKDRALIAEAEFLARSIIAYQSTELKTYNADDTQQCAQELEMDTAQWRTEDSNDGFEALHLAA